MVPKLKFTCLFILYFKHMYAIKVIPRGSGLDCFYFKCNIKIKYLH